MDPALPSLSPGLPVVLGVALLAHTVLTEPLLRARGRRALAGAADRGDHAAVRRVRRAWRARSLGAAVLALAVGAAGGLSPAGLGLRLSRDGGLGSRADAVALAAPVLAAAAAAALLALGLGGERRARARRERTRAGVLGRVVGVALLDGAAEAVVLTGLTTAVVTSLLPAAPAWQLVAVAGLVCGASRAAQRSTGVVVAGVLGAVASAVLLDTGSLLLAVVLQALAHASALLEPPLQEAPLLEAPLQDAPLVAGGGRPVTAEAS